LGKGEKIGSPYLWQRKGKKTQEGKGKEGGGVLSGAPKKGKRNRRIRRGEEKKRIRNIGTAFHRPGYRRIQRWEKGGSTEARTGKGKRKEEDVFIYLIQGEEGAMNWLRLGEGGREGKGGNF